MNRIASRRAARPDALLGWMDGLAEPTRLRILRALDRNELSVLDLCEVLAVPQSTVSRHLKVLSEGGWLASRRSGTQSLYRWAEALAPSARKLWGVARAELDGWPAVRADEGRLRAVRARKDVAHRFFAGAAGEWDRMRAEVYGRGFATEALLALLPPEWAVADLGCGTGALAAELAARVRRVVAVDQSAEMLRAARRRLAGLGNVELHEARLERLPLAAASVDAALVSLVLAYVADPAPVVAEASRILRPGGRLVIVDAARHGDEALQRRMGQLHPGFDEDELAALAAAGGFADVRSRAVPPDPGAKGPGLVVLTARRPAAEP